MSEPERESSIEKYRRRWRPESRYRTERVLGQLGLFAIGICGGLAVFGIVLIALSSHARDDAASDAYTALSAIAAASVGALAGWFARSFLSPNSPEPPHINPEGDPKYDDEPTDS